MTLMMGMCVIGEQFKARMYQQVTKLRKIIKSDKDRSLNSKLCRKKQTNCCDQKQDDSLRTHKSLNLTNEVQPLHKNKFHKIRSHSCSHHYDKYQTDNLLSDKKIKEQNQSNINSLKTQAKLTQAEISTVRSSKITQYLHYQQIKEIQAEKSPFYRIPFKRAKTPNPLKLGERNTSKQRKNYTKNTEFEGSIDIGLQNKQTGGRYNQLKSYFETKYVKESIKASETNTKVDGKQEKDFVFSMKKKKDVNIRYSARPGYQFEMKGWEKQSDDIQKCLKPSKNNIRRSCYR